MPGGEETRGSRPPDESGPAGPTGGARTASATAIAAIERTDAFRELAARRRRFTLLAGAWFYGAFAVFVVLAAWGHDWMRTRIAGGLTVGYVAALVVIVSVWAVVVAYSRASLREFDPLAERAQEDRRE
jgi:uncharacterized membrane protein (DUF485 family)